METNDDLKAFYAGAQNKIKEKKADAAFYPGAGIPYGVPTPPPMSSSAGHSDMSNLNLALLGLLTGAGTYAGLRGYRNITNQAAKPQQDANTLEVTLPKSKIPTGVDKEGSDFLENSLNVVLPGASAIAGMYGGFKGMQGLNSYFANNAVDAEKEKVKKEYLAALQRVANKTAAAAEETPLVDSFIMGLISKKATQTDMWDNLAHSMGTTVKGGLNQASDSMLNSDLAKYIGGGGIGLAGASALATYYLANRIDKNKAEAQRKTNIPTEIKLNVQ